MKYYLGIDIGTSGTKAVCFDEQGKACCSKTEEYEMFVLKPGYAEENPFDWFTATKKVISYITNQGYEISGIGLSGQMHGLVLLDDKDQILRNSIIWCDNRAILEAEELKKNIGNLVLQYTGNEVVPSFTLAKLLWVKNNEPEIFQKIHKIMLPKDYVRYMLTHSFTTEYSDASGMQMVDIFQKKYAKPILDYLEIKEEQLPILKESYEISGYVCKDLVRKLNLKEHCFVVGGAGDQAAAALGNGIVEFGDVSLVLGSSGVVFSPILKGQAKQTNLQIFMHAIPDTYHVMGVTNGCGLSYKWVKEEVIQDKSYLELNEFACQSPPLSNGVFYLPYLNGERTPHMDPYATGTWIGIRQNTTQKDLIRSVLEGVAYSLKDCFTCLPKTEYHIHITGGGAKGDLWREIIASVLNCPVTRIQQDEGGALGVAILAMVADQVYPSIKDAIAHIIRPLDVVKPNLTWVDLYKKGHPLYQNIYQSLKEFYKKAFKI